jgi:hypothetical protein
MEETKTQVTNTEPLNAQTGAIVSVDNETVETKPFVFVAGFYQ